MRSILLLSFLTMVLAVPKETLGSSQSLHHPGEAHLAALDSGLEVPLYPKSPKGGESLEAQAPRNSGEKSSWDTPSTFTRTLGSRWGAAVYKDDQIASEFSLGLAYGTLLGGSWDMGLSADIIYPPKGQIEVQFQRLFSRSRLKPQLIAGLANRPNPEKQLAFLVDPEGYFLVLGFGIQDEWTENSALKLELSGLANSEEVRLRFLVYLISPL